MNVQDLQVQHEAARQRLSTECLSEAKTICRSLLSLDFPEASEETISALQSILRLALDLAEAFCDQSETLICANRIEEGLLAHEHAEELKSDIAFLHERLGDAHLQLWDFKLAIAAYTSALRLFPATGPVQRKLAGAIEQEHQPQRVLVGCRAAIARSADSASAHLQLANALRAYRMLDEAIEEYRRVIEIEPGNVAARNNVAVALKDAGRVEEAIAQLRRALELAPDSSQIQSNLLYTLNFHPADDPDLIREAHREWNARCVMPLWEPAATRLSSSKSSGGAKRENELFVSRANDRSIGRRLRIGYVSPNFCEHCQSFFTMPLFGSHDRNAFEIYCYSDVSRPDSITDQLRSHATAWRETLGLSDERMSEMIRADQIDILVDLTMHMANNRQMMFARKPAPIQMTWLAYPGTTGQSAIDYRISDPYLDPPDAGDPGYAEKTLRLPETFWCYDPLDRSVPVAPLPASGNEFITFGCLNNFCKMNGKTLSMWREVLHRLPDSRLLLLAPDGEARRWALQSLEIDASRIDFIDYLPREQYLKLYHRIDICLDTFPYNGHTTSLDALWMGVPVVTLAGRTPASRGGLSQASNLHLSDLVAAAAQQFADTAVQLARDHGRLAELRAGLRARMLASALMDARRFARNLETLYRKVWQER